MSRWFATGRWRRPAAWLLGLFVVATVGVYGIRSFLVDRSGPVHLIVYAFSTQEEVFTQGIFPSFERAWEDDTGQDLTIEGIFGPSGTLAGQINLGAPADVAVFSNAEHVDWLKTGRRVHQDSEPILIGCTPMVIVARTDNPLGLTGYADLAKPGVSLLHADPRSSGAGEWSILAEYGSAYLPSADPAAGENQLKTIWGNVRSLASSAQAAMSQFELGDGDALVTYEQDALMALQRGVDLEIVIPPRTVVAQHAAILVDDNVTRAERPVAEAFVQFLLSDAGQQVLGNYHMRPPSCLSSRFTALIEPISAEDLGGWSKAYLELVQGLWQSEIEPGLTLEPGAGLPRAGEP